MLSSEQKKVIVLVSLVLIIGCTISLYRIYFQPLSKNYIKIENTEAFSPQNNLAASSIEEKKEPSTHVYIHVAGAIQNPGIYEVDAGLRIIDILKIAGPVLTTADLDKVNLVAKVKDGKKIYVPFNKEMVKALKKQTKLPAKKSKVQNQDNLKIDINKASLDDLLQIPSLSKKAAQSIVEYRKERGSINDINELLSIKGIGLITLEKIKKNL